MQILSVLIFIFIRISARAEIVLDPTVTIVDGVIVGTALAYPSGNAIVKYLGIPFAQSPPERFQPAQDPIPWKKPLYAQEAKPACVQQFIYPFVEQIFNNPGGPPPTESEDCLYLNIYAPAKSCKSHRAVMFWLYGGALEFGHATALEYDGSSFAANQDVIVVTTNYRLNAFGFLGPGSGQLEHEQNLGFLDQRKALEWVQTNIHAFGGDPSRVTIFGQSAGGNSVKQLLINPPTPRPFQATIMESQASTTSGSSVAVWQQLVQLVNCTSVSSQLSCMKKIPATTIKSVIEKHALSFQPTYDGVTCVNDTRPSLLSGKFTDVPILIGTNANEGRLNSYLLGIKPNAGRPALKAILNATFPRQTAFQNAILKVYPEYLLDKPYELIAQVFGDVQFTCPTSALANLAASQGYQLWRYYFNASFPNTKAFPDSGVYHAAEIPQVFGTYPQKGFTDQEIGLSRYIQKTWADFAKNPKAGTPWPQLQATPQRSNVGVLGLHGSIGEKMCHRQVLMVSVRSTSQSSTAAGCEKSSRCV